MLTARELERFERKIDKSADCWWWTSASTGNYGVFWLRGGNISAHRLAYLAYRGPIPAGLCVCHKCDNGHCVNPTHLFLGTSADNKADSVRKQRSAPQHGAYNPAAKLTFGQVARIKAMHHCGMLQREIAAKFQVRRETIGKILRGERWFKPDFILVPGVPDA